MKSDKKEENNEVEVKVEPEKKFDTTIEYSKDNGEVVGLERLEKENGYDLRTNKRVIFKPYATEDVSTGLKFTVPETHELKIFSTVTAVKEIGLTPLGGQVSIVGQNGELIVPMKNMTPRMVIIERGMPLARLLIEKINNDVGFKEIKRKIEEHDL